MQTENMLSKLPEKYKVLVITLSDRAYNGEYQDLSGKEIMLRVSTHFKKLGWDFSIDYEVLPDDSSQLAPLLEKAVREFNFIFTTGGTGIGPRDITVETVRPFLSKEIPGIMEYIRIRYGASKPGALLSRGVAGLAGIAVIYTLPGSVKAVEEYMDEIVKTIEHIVYMQYGIEKHAGH